MADKTIQHYEQKLIVEPYNHRMEIWIADSMDHVPDKLRAKGCPPATIEEFKERIHFACTIKGGRLEKGLIYACTYVIFNLDHKGAPVTPGVVVHEAYHAMCNVFEYIGHRNHTDDQEVEAVLIEWLVNQINRVLLKACELRVDKGQMTWRFISE